MRKKFASMLLLLLIIVTFANCGKSKTEKPTDTQEENQLTTEEESTPYYETLVLDCYEPENMMGLTLEELFSTYGKTTNVFVEDKGYLWVEYKYNDETIGIHVTDNVVTRVNCEYPSTGFGLNDKMTRDEMVEVLKQDKRILFIDDFSAYTIVTFYTEKETYTMLTKDRGTHYFTATVGGIETAKLADGTPVTNNSNSSNPSPSITNEEAKNLLYKYVTDQGYAAGGAAFFYVDITHDGIDELFYTNMDSEGMYGVFEIFTVQNGQVRSIYDTETNTTTGGGYEYRLYKSGGKSYIMEANFFMRQGYAMYNYHVFHLTSTGETVSLAKNSYEGEITDSGQSKINTVQREYEKFKEISQLIIGPDDDEISREIFQ